MNKSFIFSIFFLGLMFGSIESAERKMHPTDIITQVVVAGWVFNSIVKREFCGSWPDVFCTVVPLFFVPKTSDNNVDFFTVCAAINAGRILYDFFIPSQRVQNGKDSESQTDAVIVAGPWHSKDPRNYELSMVPMFDPRTKRE